MQFAVIYNYAALIAGALGEREQRAVEDRGVDPEGVAAPEQVPGGAQLVGGDGRAAPLPRLPHGRRAGARLVHRPLQLLHRALPAGGGARGHTGQSRD